jgi:hypothetical protein
MLDTIFRVQSGRKAQTGSLESFTVKMRPSSRVLGPLLFIAYVNDIWRNIESTIRLFADDCIIYRKIINSKDIEKMQMDLDSLGEWAVEKDRKSVV